MHDSRKNPNRHAAIKKRLLIPVSIPQVSCETVTKSALRTARICSNYSCHVDREFLESSIQVGRPLPLWDFKVEYFSYVTSPESLIFFDRVNFHFQPSGISVSLKCLWGDLLFLSCTPGGWLLGWRHVFSERHPVGQNAAQLSAPRRIGGWAKGRRRRHHFVGAGKRGRHPADALDGDDHWARQVINLPNPARRCD